MDRLTGSLNRNWSLSAQQPARSPLPAAFVEEPEENEVFEDSTPTMDSKAPMSAGTRGPPPPKINQYTSEGTVAYSSWSIDIRGAVKLHRDHWASAEAVVYWIYSQLGGKAKFAAEPFMVAYCDRTDAEKGEKDIKEFIDYCDGLFKDSNRNKRSLGAFVAMRQGNQPFREFIANWLAAYESMGQVLFPDMLEELLDKAMHPRLLEVTDYAKMAVTGWEAKLELIREAADKLERKGAYKTASHP
jgi:hypothetical protein